MSESNEMRGLLPCAFCGGEAQMITGPSTAIRCTNDQCIVYTQEPRPYNDHGHREAAVAAWNARAATPPASSEPEEEGEPAPENSLPSWLVCQRIINNHNFRQRAAQGLEGSVLDTAPTDPPPSALHRFIYEYDDANAYRSAWFLHRLELVLKEAHAHAKRSASSEPSDEQLAAKWSELCDTPLSWNEKVRAMIREFAPTKRSAFSESVMTAYRRDHERAVRAVEVAAELIPEVAGLSPENAIDTLKFMAIHGGVETARGMLSEGTPTKRSDATDAERTDAERYRWLRDRSQHFNYDGPARESPWTVIGINHTDCHPCGGEDLDSAVDAARSALNQQNETGGK